MTDIAETLAIRERQLAAANAQIAELSARIVRGNLGKCVCGSGLGGWGEVFTSRTVAVDQPLVTTFRGWMGGDHGGGYGGSD